ncbi:transporter substrate-binding domain-containing protein [Vibrio mediterranei]|jgi:hypothetical protein|uniref:ABC transporter substrate-binding protein n=3 Tax=Vibrio mediterranei TaxID=689 RepID=A0ABX5DBM9_9VIBR|nr:hypothetical protein COR52_11860 [Vibrio mediterranei]PRQ66633.1 hypothetical protein COR51_15555 [Vibrio mediterranei]
MKSIHFWNGNKSAYRQQYELDMLKLLINVTEDNYGTVNIMEDTIDYPDARDEGAVLENGSHLLVTVKGNAKFSGKQFIELPFSITKQLLGQRILFAKTTNLDKFACNNQIKNMTVGVPETWVDAELFRQNGYQVAERGNFDDIFHRLANDEFDFIGFGANEAEEIFQNRVANHYPIQMVDDVMLQYPFPLVFYINADFPELAERLQQGLDIILDNGKFESLYQHYFQQTEQTLALKKRRCLFLHNPFL